MGLLPPIYAEEFPMAQQCTAKSKQSGKQCKRWASPGSSVCVMHGSRGGAPNGNVNAIRHGAFAAKLSDKDRELFSALSDQPAEILSAIARLSMVRIGKLVEHEQQNQGLQLFEISDGPDGKRKLRRAVPYDEHINRFARTALKAAAAAAVYGAITDPETLGRQLREFLAATAEPFDPPDGTR
jgi:hypothetical protein